jgi:hypothetical protein
MHTSVAQFGWRSRSIRICCSPKFETYFSWRSRRLLSIPLVQSLQQHFIGKKYKVESNSSDRNDGCTASDDEEDGPGTDIELVDEESNVVQTPDRGQRNSASTVATPFMKRPPRMSL